MTGFKNLPKRVWKYCWRKLRLGIYNALIALPFFHFVRNTNRLPSPRTFRMWFIQKVLGFNRDVYWPVHFTSKINQYKHIVVGIESNPGYEPGCYIQGIGKVYIGNYTLFAQNVGVISSNHDLYDASQHDHISEVRIGDYCWLGMNSVVLPNVVLGDFTIVGAGSVVTKSFKEGYCVIAGNPARLIKKLDPAKCVRYETNPKYIGYIRAERFEAFRKKNLWI